MKRLILATAVAICGIVGSADEGTATNGTAAAVAQFLAENGWGTTEGLKAVRALRNFYKRETKTEDGRRRWHGSRRSVVVDAATGNTISTYEDGETFIDAPKAGATLKAQATTASGLPVAIAKARAAKAANGGTNEVTVVITAGGAGGGE